MAAAVGITVDHGTGITQGDDRLRRGAQRVLVARQLDERDAELPFGLFDRFTRHVGCNATKVFLYFESSRWCPFETMEFARGQRTERPGLRSLSERVPIAIRFSFKHRVAQALEGASDLVLLSLVQRDLQPAVKPGGDAPDLRREAFSARFR